MAASLLFTIFILTSCVSPIVADPRTGLLAKVCGNVRVRDSSKYVRSYGKLLEAMHNDMRTDKFSTGEDGEAPNRIYVLAQCMGDLSGADCAACFLKITAHLPGCFPFTGGRVFLDGCFMRFDNYSFFQETTSSYDVERCSDDVSSEQYVNASITLVDGLVERAPAEEGYAVETTASNGSTVYGLANCWKTLDRDQCTKCLGYASSSVSDCLPAEEGRALNAGCFLRYSNYPFANESAASNNGGIVLSFLAYVLGGVVFCLLVIIAGFNIGKTVYKRKQNRRYEREVMEMKTSVSVRSLRFKYSTLQKATEDFSPEQKIGQGGYGEVFRGVFPDGREIAIKRLFTSSKHQVEEVRNEMDIISQAQHKNLVRFLGFCLADDSLLVYEFLANKSLDHVLFGRSREEKRTRLEEKAWDYQRNS